LSETELLYEFEKNAAERVRAELTNWNGRDVFNLRVFFDAGNGTPDWRPTKKGLTIRTELIPDLKKAVDVAFQRYEEMERQAELEGAIG
jgi:hypothetical protein